jgi:hypothetical protein
MKLFLLILFAVYPLLGQTAEIAGFVEDPSHGLVANARITVINEQTAVERKTRTTDAGIYAVPLLPPGKYQVIVDADGFETQKRQGLTLEVEQKVRLDFLMTITKSQQAITVIQDAPLVGASKSQVSTVVNERSVRNLPINNRNFLDFTLLTPGVTRDTRVGDLSFAGQRGPANSLLVDGMDSNSTFWGQSAGRAGLRAPYTFSQDAVQEFQVDTNDFSTEYGRATGGIVNVIIRSGTNDFHGTGFWFFRDRAMNANTFINNAKGIVRQPYHYNQSGGNLAGPILKNRLFFFFNYEAQRNTAPNPVYFPIAVPSDAASQAGARALSQYLTPYTTGSNSDVITAKIDWAANASHVLSARYNASRYSGTNLEVPGPQSPEGHTGTTTLDTDGVTLSHDWSLGPNKILNQRFLFYREHNPSSANSEGPEVVVRQSGVVFMQFGRSNALPRFIDQHKYGAVQTLSWNIGRHSLKSGHDIKFERAHQYATNLFFGQYLFNSLASFANGQPSSYAQTFTGQGTEGGNVHPDGDDYAFFVEDSWRPTGRLTLNYGLRYDLFLYAQGPVLNPNPALLAADLRTGHVPRDYKDIAPRFGFAYRLDSQSRYVIRGGFGSFYGRLPGLTVRLAHQQNGIQTATLTLTGASVPIYPTVLTAPPSSTAAADIYVMQHDLISPHSYQWNFQIQGQVGHDFAITAGYFGLRGLHLTRIRDINQFPAQTALAYYADGTPVTFERRPGTTGPLRPNANFGRISLIESGADSIYHGAFLQVQKRYGDRFQALASYTFSKVIDDAPDATPSIPNSVTEDPKIVQNTLNPNADRGIGNANLTHRFVLSGVWDISYLNQAANAFSRSILGGWQISTIVTAQSGLWYNATSNADLNNDGNSYTDRSPGYGRNTIQGPGLATVDLRVSKEIPLGREQVKLRLIGEAFNSFNRANFSAIQQTPFNYSAATNVFTRNSNFLAPTATYDPRILQLAARITF